MRKTSRFALLSLSMALTAPAVGCDSITGSSLLVERLPDVTPSLPPVPQLPPPAYPVTYEDGSHSVSGARQRLRTTGPGEIEVTGYIVDVYKPPACEKGETCARPDAPHVFIADALGAGPRDRMLVVGYARNQAEIDDAVRHGARGAQRARDQGITPVPRDFNVGNRIKVKGDLAVMSNQGFSASNGLVEYTDHETIETAE